MTDLKRPRDPDQLAKFVADRLPGEATAPPMTEDGKDLAAVLLGRRGGLKGGRARADSMTPEERRRIAKLAAQARWSKEGAKK